MEKSYKKISGDIQMISIIITSFKEPKTIGKAIEAIGEQKIKKSEIIVVAPDEETLNAAKEYSKKYTNILLLKDEGRGKPAALNLAVSKSKGDILVLTDGDVYVGENSVNYLLEHFKDERIGAASGRVISLNSKNNKYGFWAEMLTDIAHRRRKFAESSGKRFFCTGYLFAIRKELFPALREDLLSEDGFISHMVYTKGKKIKYEARAKVFVKYPSNFRDWIKQKKRSAGGYNQIRALLGVEIRSFKKESSGMGGFFRYVTSLSELIWLIELLAARIYLWFLIYKDINFRNKGHREIWERVESTK